MIEICSESGTVTANNRRTEGLMNIEQIDEHHINPISNDDTEQKTIK